MKWRSCSFDSVFPLSIYPSKFLTNTFPLESQSEQMWNLATALSCWNNKKPVGGAVFTYRRAPKFLGYDPVLFSESLKYLFLKEICWKVHYPTKVGVLAESLAVSDNRNRGWSGESPIISYDVGAT